MKITKLNFMREPVQGVCPEHGEKEIIQVGYCNVPDKRFDGNRQPFKLDCGCEFAIEDVESWNSLKENYKKARENFSLACDLFKKEENTKEESDFIKEVCNLLDSASAEDIPVYLWRSGMEFLESEDERFMELFDIAENIEQEDLANIKLAKSEEEREEEEFIALCQEECPKLMDVLYFVAENYEEEKELIKEVFPHEEVDDFFNGEYSESLISLVKKGHRAEELKDIPSYGKYFKMVEERA